MTKAKRRPFVAAGLLAMVAVGGGAFAGEEPFIATVCDDAGWPSVWGCDRPSGVNTGDGMVPRLADTLYPNPLAAFYLSPKEYQFTHLNRDAAYAPAPGYAPFAAGERFRASTPINREDPCDALPNIGFPQLNALYPGQNAQVIYPTNRTARLVRGNQGFYEWTIVLPKKPKTNFNIAIQCALLKNQEIDITDCAGEAGEVPGNGRCTNTQISPGQSTIRNTALPLLTATAYPGLYSRTFPETTFTPFNLTAFLFPGNGVLTAAINAEVVPVNRIPLKACMTENVYVRMPVTGTVNSAGQTENDLEAGDFIVVRLQFPRGHTMDVYCHAQSVKIKGIGDPGTLLDPTPPDLCPTDQACSF